MKTKIKIAIADDHPLMIDGIRTVLSDNPEIEKNGEASNGLEIIEAVKKQKSTLNFTGTCFLQPHYTMETTRFPIYRTIFSQYWL